MHRDLWCLAFTTRFKSKGEGQNYILYAETYNIACIINVIYIGHHNWPNAISSCLISILGDNQKAVSSIEMYIFVPVT